MNQESRIYVAGHTGLVGSALVRRLGDRGYTNLITRNHAELDLRDFSRVRSFFEQENPDYVILAAARVGGIQANSDYPADFIYDNISIQTSVIQAAYLSKVQRLIFFGSNCTYPKESPQPMPEDYLLTGALEPTSEPYAVAKIAGMKMCESFNRQYGTCFISLIPSTLYGPNDDFDERTSHVLSALMARYHQSKQTGQESVVVWGSGRPRREFLYVDDLADACIFLLKQDTDTVHDACRDSGWVMNAGSGSDVSIMELAISIQNVVGYQGQTKNDPSLPDGAPRKLLDSSRFKELGWSPKITLEEGIKRTYAWYVENEAKTAVHTGIGA